MNSSTRNDSPRFIEMNKSSLDTALTSVITVNYNGLRHTREVVLSVLRRSPGTEIIVVDNCSTDGSVAALKDEFPSLTVLPMNENKGFACGCNHGAKAANGKYLFFVNNDAVLSEDTPNILASFLDQHSAVAACGPRLINPDGSFQLSFGLDPGIFNEWIVRGWQRRLRKGSPSFASRIERRFSGKKVDWVSGAALMIRTDVFRRVGGFDEFFFMYFEDADLCKRIRELAGEVRFVNTTSVTHLLGQSAKDAKSRVALVYRKSQLHYYEKHLPSLSVHILRFYLYLRGYINKRNEGIQGR